MKRLTAVALLLALSATGCGGDDPSPSASGSGSAAAATKPTVTVPAGPPPARLVIEDMVVGTGAEAKNGTTVSVHYVGVSYSTGQEFDASWDGGQPFQFQLPGNVIAGWNQGVPGMKVGGRRKLVIPPDLGYGPEGSGPIKPNETLIFVIDLLEVSGA